MMEDDKQAFPWAHQDGDIVGGSGMTLREYYAGCALQGLCANPRETEKSELEHIVMVAFQLSDAMIANDSV